MPDPADRPVPTPSVQNILRLAFIAGALILGGVGWILAGEQREPLLDEATGELVRLGFFVVALSTLGGLEFLRRQHRRSEDPKRRFALALTGYALGDAVAIFGFVFVLLTGAFTPYLVGLLILLLACVMFPPDDSVTGRSSAT